MEPYMHEGQLKQLVKMNENLEKIANELKISNELKKKELESKPVQDLKSQFRGK